MAHYLTKQTGKEPCSSDEQSYTVEIILDALLFAMLSSIVALLSSNSKQTIFTPFKLVYKWHYDTMVKYYDLKCDTTEIKAPFPAVTPSSNSVVYYLIDVSLLYCLLVPTYLCVTRRQDNVSKCLLNVNIRTRYKIYTRHLHNVQKYCANMKVSRLLSKNIENIPTNSIKTSSVLYVLYMEMNRVVNVFITFSIKAKFLDTSMQINFRGKR